MPTLMSNPMTTAGDMIDGGTNGTAQRLPIGTSGQVLTVVSGVPAWATPSSGGGMTNPMTAANDIIVGGTSGTPTRLAEGTTGQVLTVGSSGLQWATPGSGGGIPMVDRPIYVPFDYPTIQAAINAALAVSTSNPPSIYIAAGNYAVPSGGFTIGSSTSTNLTGLRIVGDSRLGTMLTQSNANQPIFTITGNLIHSLEFRNMTLQYASLQTAAQTSSNVFNIVSTSSGSFFNSIFDNLNVVNQNMFMNCTTTSWWGNVYRDCWFQDCSLGINNITIGAGEPRCLFQNLYIRCPSCTGTLFTHNAMTAIYQNVEVNGATSGATMLLDDGGGTHMIDHWALEVATYNAAGNTILFELHNSVMLARHIYLNTLTIGSAATVYAVHCEQTSGNISYYDIRYAFGVNWTATGNFYFSDSPGGQKCHIGQINLPWAANVALTTATFQADNLVVDDWNDPSNTNFITTSSVTLSYNSPRQQIFDANLTAATTVTIPDSTAVPNNLFMGRRFNFVKTNRSAFLITIKTTSGTVVDTIPASTQGEVEVMYAPDSGVSNGEWVTIRNITY